MRSSAPTARECSPVRWIKPHGSGTPIPAASCWWLAGHTDSVFKAEFSRDGTRILTVSDDGTARVWDSVTHEQRYRAFSATAAVN